MTVGERVIYKTIISNLDVFLKNDKVFIHWSEIQNKEQFKEGLKSLAGKGFIVYDINFINVEIRLSVKGKQIIDAGKDFDILK